MKKYTIEEIEQIIDEAYEEMSNDENIDYKQIDGACKLCEILSNKFGNNAD